MNQLHVALLSAVLMQERHCFHPEEDRPSQGNSHLQLVTSASDSFGMSL